MRYRGIDAGVQRRYFSVSELDSKLGTKSWGMRFGIWSSSISKRTVSDEIPYYDRQASLRILGYMNGIKEKKDF